MEEKEELLSQCGLSNEYLSILKEFKGFSSEYAGSSIEENEYKENDIELKSMIINNT